MKKTTTVIMIMTNHIVARLGGGGGGGGGFHELILRQTPWAAGCNGESKASDTEGYFFF